MISWTRLKALLMVLMFFICSIHLGIFCQPPFLPLIFIKAKYFRYVSDKLQMLWILMIITVIEQLNGVKIRVFGEPIQMERSVILMNHRTRIDWLFFWQALFSMDTRLLGSEKIILKSLIKRVPASGFAIEMLAYIFVRRNWQEDSHVFDAAVEFYRKIDNPYQIFIFPEGTDLCDNTLKRSNDFAESRGLPKFQYVLHPRSTGFVHLVQKMRKENYFDAVYDVTVGYVSTFAQTEVDFAHGHVPKEIHFLVKRYDAAELPQSSEDIQVWLSSVWNEKEKSLEQFHSTPQRHFAGVKEILTDSRRPLRSLQLWFGLLFWSSISIFCTYLLMTTWWARIYFAVTYGLFMFIERYCGGLEKLQFQLVRRNIGV